jgi:predicted metal-dependent phosphoesterase TrpH
LEGVAGVELSSELEGAKIHLLGYFIDWTDGELLRNLALLRQKRNERNEKIVKALGLAGAKIGLDEVEGLGQQSISRVHFAKVLCRHGYSSSIPEAFTKYLAYGAEAYVPRETLKPEEAIALIKRAKGQAYLAHLNQIRPKTGTLEDLAAKLKNMGLDGIEAYYGEYDIGMTQYYISLADKLGLKVSAGSDFHGSNKRNPLGVDGEGRRFSYEILEGMRRGEK